MHARSCPTLCHPYGLQLARLLCPWDFPGRNTGAGCHYLLQWIFPTQGLNLGLLCLLHCRQILYRLSHQRSPKDWRVCESGIFPEDLPDPGIETRSLALQADSLPFELQEDQNTGVGSGSQNTGVGSLSLLQGTFRTQVSHIAGRFFISWATGEAQEY